MCVWTFRLEHRKWQTRHFFSSESKYFVVAVGNQRRCAITGAHRAQRTNQGKCVGWLDCVSLFCILPFSSIIPRQMWIGSISQSSGNSPPSFIRAAHTTLPTVILLPANHSLIRHLCLQTQKSHYVHVYKLEFSEVFGKRRPHLHPRGCFPNTISISFPLSCEMQSDVLQSTLWCHTCVYIDFFLITKYMVIYTHTCSTFVNSVFITDMHIQTITQQPTMTVFCPYH